MVVNMQEVRLDDDNSPFQFLQIGESNNFSRNAASECHLHCDLIHLEVLSSFKVDPRSTDFVYFLLQDSKKGLCGIRIESFIQKPVCKVLGMGGGSPSSLDYLIFYVPRSHIENNIFSAECKRKVTYIFFIHCFYSETMFLTQRWSRF